MNSELSVEAVIRGERERLGAGAIRPFDAHSHTGVDIDGTSRTAEEHVRELEEIGGRSVIFPLCVDTGYPAENERVIEESRLHPDRLVPFARIDPRVSGAADAAAALAAGARGFKLHPRAEDFRLDDPGVAELFGVAAEARVPVLIHAGVGVGSFGESLTTLAAGYPDCPIILAHAGISDLVWLAEVVSEHPNLFFDTAWLVPADLLALFALVPAERILYGSDAPLMDVELLLTITLRCARFSGLSEEEIGLVMGGQLENLLAREAAAETGPAPGLRMTLSPSEYRVAQVLSGVGGGLYAGGDTTLLLEVARLAIGDEGGLEDSQPSLNLLLDHCVPGSPEAIRAIVLALTVALTPGVESAAAVGADGR